MVSTPSFKIILFKDDHGTVFFVANDKEVFVATPELEIVNENLSFTEIYSSHKRNTGIVIV